MKLQDKDFGDPLDFPSYKGRINQDFKKPFLLQKLEDCDRLLEEQGHHIFTDRRNRVGLVQFPVSEGKSTGFVVKEFRTQGLNNLKAIFFPSRAQKAWRGGVSLMERGIPTPAPVAYLESKKYFSTRYDYYVTLMEQGSQEIRHMFRSLQGNALEGLLRALARQLFFCHKQGILHRDLSDGNILVGKRDEEEYRFSLIDTNRIRIKRRIGLFRRIKNLIRLGIPRAYQPYFLRQYTETGELKKGIWCWYRVNKRTYTEYTKWKRKLLSRSEK